MERTVPTILIQSHQHQRQLTYLLISQHLIENIVVIIKMTTNLQQSTVTNKNIGCVSPPIDSDCQKQVAKPPVSVLNFLYQTVNGNTHVYLLEGFFYSKKILVFVYSQVHLKTHFLIFDFSV